MGELTYKEVASLLRYDHEAGMVFWLADTKNHKKPGERAGANHNKGYRSIKIKKKCYLEHRVCWVLHYGYWPEKSLDHINGNKKDNRIVNLRYASNAENIRNTKRNSRNTTGFKGVNYDPVSKRYKARVRVPGGKRISLGTFDTAEAAYDAYVKEAKKLFGEFFHAG